MRTTYRTATTTATVALTGAIIALAAVASAPPPRTTPRCVMVDAAPQPAAHVVVNGVRMHVPAYTLHTLACGDDVVRLRVRP